MKVYARMYETGFGLGIAKRRDTLYTEAFMGPGYRTNITGSSQC